MKFLLMLLGFLIKFENSTAQSAYNIVSNGDFEYGSTIPLCFDASNDISNQVSEWIVAQSSPDWMDASNCLNQMNSTPTYCLPFLTMDDFPSNRFIRLAATQGNEEAIRIGIPTLTPGVQYVFRIKMMQTDCPPSHINGVQILLTKWGQHWYSNSAGNVKFTVANFSIPGGSPQNAEWISQEAVFTAPSTANDLGNLVILASIGGTCYYDDVELYEYCNDNLLIENRLYSYVEPIYEADQNIIAGYDSSEPYGPDGIGNVIVQNRSCSQYPNRANVTYKAGANVILEPGFDAEMGSEFLAYIEPCNGWDDFPENRSTVLNECVSSSNHCFQIGGNYDGNYQYSWSPTTGLNNPNIPNPIACLPSSGFGTITYILTVTDVSGSVINFYTTIIHYWPSINYINGFILTNYPTPPSQPVFYWHCHFNIPYNTEQIILNFTNSSPQLYGVYSLNAGVDWGFPTSTSNIDFDFTTGTDYFPSDFYTIVILLKVFCYDQWDAHMGYAFNHNIGSKNSSDSMIYQFSTDTLTISKRIINNENYFFSMTPNPCKNNVSVTYSLAIQKAVIIDFYNYTGTKVKEFSFSGGENSKTLDLSDFANGIYSYQVYSGHDFFKVEKIVVIN